MDGKPSAFSFVTLRIETALRCHAPNGKCSGSLRFIRNNGHFRGQRTLAHVAFVVAGSLLLASESIAAGLPKQTPEFEAGSGYFIDFRARQGALLGHNFIVYGRITPEGRLFDVKYAGNYPVSGKTGLVMGAIVPVRTEIGAVKGDFTDPATIVFRRRISATDFVRLNSAIRHIRKTEQYWHLLFFNCNDFVVAIVRSLGMRSPPPWLLPHAFVAALRALNSP